jgi:hypothetical protein
VVEVIAVVFRLWLHRGWYFPIADGRHSSFPLAAAGPDCDFAA